jgi:hypothetical protein
MPQVTSPSISNEEKSFVILTFGKTLNNFANDEAVCSGLPFSQMLD